MKLNAAVVHLEHLGNGEAKCKQVPTNAASSLQSNIGSPRSVTLKSSQISNIDIRSDNNKENGKGLTERIEHKPSRIMDSVVESLSLADEELPSIVDVIKKKRDKLEWTRNDIHCFVQGATYGRITDAQIGAGLMAICLNGMSDQETSDLTQEMINTGVRIPRPSHWPPKSVVGKHSTGGVGDKVTIVLSPLLAACGLKVPKLSGRGLGHTGGTLDKLESIPGFRVQYSTQEIVELVDRVGCCIVGVSEKLSPADKILYAIRDTTGTTESLPLVAGSVMCKKAAESLDSLSLEVTYGRAALIKTRDEAVRLSRLMIATGQALGIRTAAVLVRMENVLGRTVGNSLEISEAVDCMHGHGPSDIVDICCALGSYLLVEGGVVSTREAGTEMIRLRLQDGSTARKFYEMMVAQGVKESVARRVARLDLVRNGRHSNGQDTNGKHSNGKHSNGSHRNDGHSNLSTEMVQEYASCFPENGFRKEFNDHKENGENGNKEFVSLSSHDDFSEADDDGDDEDDMLPKASIITKLHCETSGYVSAVDAYTCGHVVRNLGAGRSRPDDVIDYSAGLRLLISLGQYVTTGSAWVEVHHNRALTREMTSDLQSALVVTQQPPLKQNVVVDSILE